MRKIVIGIITFYQGYLSVFLTHVFGTKVLCRYSPTCSEYAKQAISKKGVIIGLYITAVRLLSCQPFSK